MAEQKPENVIFQKGNIVITNTRAIIGEKTYAMSNITSVSTAKIDANMAPGGMALLFGIAIGGCLIVSADSTLLGLLIGGAIGALGIFAMVQAKPQYIVRIGSASGESDAMKSIDEEEIKSIVFAINKAIVDRG